MSHLISLIINFFVELWRVDERREARQFVLGCLVVVVILFGVLLSLGYFAN